ncbi:MAG: hypothetical protein WD208_04335 [Dehalococcoidia bacterium]
MGIALGTALVLASMAVLIYPFINRRRYEAPGDPTHERLRVARLRVYRQISDLEADHRAADLTEEDYRAQLREHRIIAAQIMREEARLGNVPADEDDLEREIESARRRRSGALEGGDTL